MRLVLLLLVVACSSTPPRTELVVRVQSNFPAGQLDTITVTASRADGSTRSATAESSGDAFSFSVNFAHRNGPLGPVRVLAEGFESGVSAIRVRESASFVVGETVNVELTLDPSCRQNLCTEEERCEGGVCFPLGERDGGVVDAAPSDVSVSDGSADSGVLDTGIDVGDAGPCPPRGWVLDTSERYDCPDSCNCEIVCTSGNTCDVHCDEGQMCRVLVRDDATLDLECDDTACIVRTQGSANVDANCDKATCDVQCASAATCDVRCRGGGASCALLCEGGPASCGYRECMGGGGERDCGGGRTYCRRACD